MLIFEAYVLLIGSFKEQIFLEATCAIRISKDVISVPLPTRELISQGPLSTRQTYEELICGQRSSLRATSTKRGLKERTSATPLLGTVTCERVMTAQHNGQLGSTLTNWVPCGLMQDKKQAIDNKANAANPGLNRTAPLRSAARLGPKALALRVIHSSTSNALLDRKVNT
jgi:hypothetical protein